MGDRRTHNHDNRSERRHPEARVYCSEQSERRDGNRESNQKRRFISEASVYLLLKEHDLIASPAYIVMKAADEFKDKTTAPNQLWQTDFTYLKVIGWAESAKDPAMRSIVGWQAEGWFYFSTILNDFSRAIIAWKLCTTMKVGDVTETLDLALQASGLDQFMPFIVRDCYRTMALTYISADLAEWLDKRNLGHEQAMRGIALINALVPVTEVGDFTRFSSQHSARA